jgi:putative endonuclease
VPYYVYILKSETTGRSYIGHSQNLQKRVAEHNNSKSKSTRGKGPWRLVHHEEYATRPEAVRQEMYYKTIEGRLLLKSKEIL